MKLRNISSVSLQKFKLSDLLHFKRVSDFFCLHHYKMQKRFVNKYREKTKCDNNIIICSIYFLCNQHQTLVTFDNINNLLKHLLKSDLTRKRYHYIIFNFTINSYIRFVFKLDCSPRHRKDSFHLKPPIQKRQP